MVEGGSFHLVPSQAGIFERYNYYKRQNVVALAASATRRLLCCGTAEGGSFGARFFSYFNHNFYFPAQFARAFYSRDQAWSQASSVQAPRFSPSLLSRRGFSVPAAHRFPPSFTNSRFRMLGDMRKKGTTVMQGHCTRAA